MSTIAIWSLAGISMVFCLGLISAIESRRQRRAKPIKQDTITARKEYVRVSVSTRKDEEPKTAMSMAAGGTGNVSVNAFKGNAEENLASIGSQSR